MVAATANFLKSAALFFPMLKTILILLGGERLGFCLNGVRILDAGCWRGLILILMKLAKALLVKIIKYWNALVLDISKWAYYRGE